MCLSHLFAVDLTRSIARDRLDSRQLEQHSLQYITSLELMVLQQVCIETGVDNGASRLHYNHGRQRIVTHTKNKHVHSDVLY